MFYIKRINVKRGSFTKKYFNMYLSRIKHSERDILCEKIVITLKPKRNDRILDAGCGVGVYSFILSKYAKVIGLDKSIEALQYCKKYYPNLNFYQCDVLNLPFRNNYFDKILAVHIIEHINDCHKALKEIKRVLKPNGLVLFGTLIRDNWFKKLFIRDTTHVKEFNVNEFCNIIASEFEIIDKFRMGSFINYYPLNIILSKIIKPDIYIVARKSRS